MNEGDPTKSLKDLIQRFFTTAPFQKQLTLALLRSTWYRTMPKVVGDRTEKLYIRHNKIYLKITSAALRQELQLNKEKIFTLLQKATPTTPFHDVVFI